MNFNKIDSFGKEDTANGQVVRVSDFSSRCPAPGWAGSSLRRDRGTRSPPTCGRCACDPKQLRSGVGSKTSVLEAAQWTEGDHHLTELPLKPSLRFMPDERLRPGGAGLRPGVSGLRPEVTGLRSVEDLDTRRMFLGSPNSDQTSFGLHSAVVSGPRSGRASPRGLCAGDRRNQERLVLEAEDQSVKGTTKDTATPNERYLVSRVRTRIYVFSSKDALKEFDEHNFEDQLLHAVQSNSRKTGTESKN